MRYVLCLIFISLSPLLSAMPDFSKYPYGTERQAVFFNYLKPLVQQSNAQILSERSRLLALYRLRFIAKKNLTDNQLTWLKFLFDKYRLEISDKRGQWLALIHRVDIIPTSLALAQAASETAFGTTRFAKEANNFYGMWCETPGCGLVPYQRKKSETHEIKKYPSVEASVAAYMLNLNTNKYYFVFRELRAQERHYGKYPSGVILASGLLYYSQLREAYVEGLQKIIIQYQLEKTIDYRS